MEDAENLPAPDVLAAEIVDQLEAPLEEFRGIEEVLGVCMKNPQLAVSITALIVAVSSAIATVYISRTEIDLGVKPVSVMEFDNSRGWRIRNIGNGPAMNILVTYKNNKETIWRRQMRVYPLAKDDEVPLCEKWIGYSPSIINVTYNDSNNKPYTSTTEYDLTKTDRGYDVPGKKQAGVDQYWKECPKGKRQFPKEKN